MSDAEDRYVALAATDFLALDQEKVVEYLDKNRNAHGGYDISGLADVKRLTKSQRCELAEKIKAATLRLEMSPFLKMNELLTRLATVADGQDGSRSLDRGLSRPLVDSFHSIEGTPPPIDPKDSEASCYQGLIEDGGRPVCSIEHLLNLLTSPTASHDAVLPWLSNYPDSEDGVAEIKTVFSRQFARWWDFRKSQWHNRGIDDSQEGFSAFLEAIRGRWWRIGAHAMVSDPDFDETAQRQWQLKPESRQLPDGQGFPAYCEAVKRRLAPYRFAHSLQLKKNPRQQTAWTNWLEYLNYEQWWSEQLTAVAESLVEERYHQPRKRLREASRCSSGEAMGFNGTNATSRLAALGPLPIRQHRPGPKAVDLAKELEAARAALDAATKSIDDFIRETERYTQAQIAAYYQRLRVKWAVEEARLMETEMSQQRRTAKVDTKADTGENKKRKHGDDEEMPQTRRSSKRLNKLKDNAPP